MAQIKFKLKKGKKINFNDDLLIPIGGHMEDLCFRDKSKDDGYDGDIDCNDYRIISEDFEVIINTKSHLSSN